MTLDGLQTLLAERFKRRSINYKIFRYKVNLVRYADDFIITGYSKELLENEVKPLVVDFLKGAWTDTFRRKDHHHAHPGRLRFPRIQHP